MTKKETLLKTADWMIPSIGTGIGLGAIVANLKNKKRDLSPEEKSKRLLKYTFIGGGAGAVGNVVANAIATAYLNKKITEALRNAANIKNHQENIMHGV